MNVQQITQNLIRSGAVIVDTETTGIRNIDVVIDIAVIAMDGTVLLETLIKPPATLEIQKAAQAKHGINLADLENASILTNSLYRQLRYLLLHRPVVAYNKLFDERFLNQTLTAWDYELLPIDWHCAMKLSQKYFNVKSIKLQDAAKNLGINVVETHRARADAETTRQVCLKYAEEF